MNRVEVSKPIHGLLLMQVCAESDVTDEEILETCNSENPSGTSGGWQEVIRGTRGGRWGENQLPLKCEQNPERMHFLVSC